MKTAIRLDSSVNTHFRKSLAPPFGLTTQYHECPVRLYRLLPISHTKKVQKFAVQNSFDFHTHFFLIPFTAVPLSATNNSAASVAVLSRRENLKSSN